jgi:hypothetical protein
VGVGGCARLRWSAAGVRSVSSARIRCARALWAVSGRRPAPRPRGRRPRPAGLLASLSPPADRPGVPCLRRACRLQPAHLVAWRPLAAAAGAAGSLGRAPRNPSGIPEEVAVWAALASLAARRSPPGLLSLHRRSRRSSCPCSAQDVAPSRPSAICGRRTPESVLRAAAAARPTARRFQSIPRDPHAMEAGTARLRARPHSILRTRVLFDCAAAWTRLGVRVTRGRRPRRRRRGWLACAAGGGGNFD